MCNLNNFTKVTQADPPTFFAILRENYEAAAAKMGSITYCFRIAGYTVRIAFAGPALVAPLLPALAHLTIPDVAMPDLTLCLWDGMSTGFQPPRAWTPADVDLRGEVRPLSNEQILTTIQMDVNAVSVLDQSRALGFYWIDSACSLRAYERAAPLKVLLHWWLRTRGLSMIHAGAVGLNDGAVLIVGKTGAGKSTTTLACFAAGMAYLSDDRCLLTLEPEPQAYCLYNTAKLHPAQMARFPRLLATVTNPHETREEKALIYLQQFAPQQLALCLPIRAILLAKVAGTTTTTLAPVSRMAVLRDFVTSTLVYQPGAAQDEVNMMTALVRQAPCYQINLGSDLAGIPPVIAQAIAHGHIEAGAAQ